MNFIVICNSPKDCLNFLRINKICVKDSFFLINNFITTFDNDNLKYNDVFFTSFNYKNLVKEEFFFNEICIQSSEYSIKDHNHAVDYGNKIIIPATYSSPILDRLLLRNVDLKFKYLNDVDQYGVELSKTIDYPVKFNELLAKGFDISFLKAAIFPSKLFTPEDFKASGMWRVSDFFNNVSLEVSYDPSIKFFKINF